MELKISMFKSNGKFYASRNVKTDKNISVHDEKFKKFIVDNLPAKACEGYVIVIGEDKKFTAEYKTSELRNF